MSCRERDHSADQPSDAPRRVDDDVTARAARAADTIRLLAPLPAVVALLCAAAAVWLSADRGRAVVQLGIGAAGGGLLVIVAWDVARALAVGSVDGPDARAAVAGVWDAFLRDLHTAAWIHSMSVPLPGWYSSRAGRADRRPAALRHPRAPARHPLR